MATTPTGSGQPWLPQQHSERSCNPLTQRRVSTHCNPFLTEGTSLPLGALTPNISRSLLEVEARNATRQHCLAQACPASPQAAPLRWDHDLAHHHDAHRVQHWPMPTPMPMPIPSRLLASSSPYRVGSSCEVSRRPRRPRRPFSLTDSTATTYHSPEASQRCGGGGEDDGDAALF